MVTLAEASPRHANIKKPVFWDLNRREVAIGLDIDRVESAPVMIFRVPGPSCVNHGVADIIQNRHAKLPSAFRY